MAGLIHILPEALMKRIAAGEIIERPASVVKELLENAIDAGATEITLTIEQAGFRCIQVSDNGCGMGEEDALLCVQRHATSKIRDPGDLEAIHTLGFRGEALASIGAVSRMTLTTRTVSDETATRVFVEEGEVCEVMKCAATPGTTIRMEDLFYNVPARKKFMKSPATELRQLMNAFRRIALAYPEIRFQLDIDGQTRLDLPSSSLKGRIRDLLGPEKTAHLLWMEKRVGSLGLSGYLARPGHFLRTRDDQYFFVNRRAVTHKGLLHAVLSAYGPRLGNGEHPLFLVYLEMAPRFVDVNVHPAKHEVRFADEKFVHDTLYTAIEETLKTPQSIPELGIVSHRPRAYPSLSSNEKRMMLHELGQLTLDAETPSDGGRPMSRSGPSGEQGPFYQVHHRYILSQIRGGLTLIDQHAAHERILFEWAQARREEEAGLSQRLLFPQTVQLSPDDFGLLLEILPFLVKIGFEIREFGNRTLVIEAVPPEVKPGGECELLQEILATYREEGVMAKDRFEAVAAAFACHAAIKSGDPLNQMEMASLVDRLFATENPYACPHGRPTVVTLRLEEIDKRFGR